MQVKLIKVTSSHQNLRTSEVIGETHQLPTEGTRFIMYSEPLQEGYTTRYIETTPIKEVERQEDGSFVFRTENSTYKLELLNV